MKLLIVEDVLMPPHPLAMATDQLTPQQSTGVAADALRSKGPIWDLVKLSVGVSIWAIVSGEPSDINNYNLGMVSIPPVENGDWASPRCW